MLPLPRGRTQRGQCRASLGVAEGEATWEAAGRVGGCRTAWEAECRTVQCGRSRDEVGCLHCTGRRQPGWMVTGPALPWEQPSSGGDWRDGRPAGRAGSGALKWVCLRSGGSEVWTGVEPSVVPDRISAPCCRRHQRGNAGWLYESVGCAGDQLVVLPARSAGSMWRTGNLSKPLDGPRIPEGDGMPLISGF